MQLRMLKIQVFSHLNIAHCTKAFASFQFTEECSSHLCGQVKPVFSCARACTASAEELGLKSILFHGVRP